MLNNCRNWLTSLLFSFFLMSSLTSLTFASGRITAEDYFEEYLPKKTFKTVELYAFHKTLDESVHCFMRDQSNLMAASNIMIYMERLNNLYINQKRYTPWTSLLLLSTDQLLTFMTSKSDSLTFSYTDSWFNEDIRIPLMITTLQGYTAEAIIDYASSFKHLRAKGQNAACLILELFLRIPKTSRFYPTHQQKILEALDDLGSAYTPTRLASFYLEHGMIARLSAYQRVLKRRLKALEKIPEPRPIGCEKCISHNVSRCISVKETCTDSTPLKRGLHFIGEALGKRD